MTMFVLLLLYVVDVLCDLDFKTTIAEKTEIQNETGLLVNNLRRRLMEDNYDYQTDESEESPVLRQHDDEISDNLESYLDDSKEVSHDEHVNNLFMPRAHDNSHAISKKDLLYYVDDAKLGSVKRRVNNEVIEDVYTDDFTDEANDTINNTTTPKVKYKLLKVRNNQNRRSGSAYQRLIQEEGVDGIAVMALDDGPLPQFRLPESRRQYMNHDGFTEEEFTEFSFEDPRINNGSLT